MAADLLCCACCKDELSSTSDENQALTCGHVFHKDCISDYCRVANTDLSKIECPLCKLSAPVVELMAATTAVPLPENDANIVIDQVGVVEESMPESTSEELPVPQTGTQQVCTLICSMLAFVRPFVTAVTIRGFDAT